MILQDLGIPYKIIEARGDVGGRLFTYRFPNDLGAPYNYYDVGAMRFPKIGSMNRIFNLFENEHLNTPDIALKDRLKPFYFTGAGNNNTLLSYNGVTVRQNAVPPNDPFKAKDVIQDVSAQQYIAAGTKAITDDVIAPFAEALLKDLETGGKEGWDKMRAADDYSTRAYMAFKYAPSSALKIPNGPLPTDVVNWCETFDKSTGWYDRAFSETVLEAIAFGWKPGPNPPPTQWFCVDGGSNKIAQAMSTYLGKQSPNFITFNSRVNYIGVGSDGGMEVGVDGTTTPQKFSHVISTIPLPVLRTIDLTNAGLSPMQANALRQLNYGPSVKIGMQFRTAWWTVGNDKQGNPLNIIGGQTYTDRPLRTVVYPSFGDVNAGKTTTLIASYCWTEDSTRLGALINNDHKFLSKLVLKELADIHNVDLDYLTNQFMDMKAWSWSHDPYTMGAFAFFGPGKFKNVYASLNSPAGSGYLHFAGEALSVRHAWVEGALDSAWRAVSEMLINDEFSDETRQKFTDNWGANPEWIKSTTEKVPVDHGRLYKLPASAIFSATDSLLYEHIALTQ